MLETRNPSYLPPPIENIPEELIIEEGFWHARPGLVLEESSAREMIRSVEINRALLGGNLLAEMGLNKKAPGVGTLQGHGTRVCLDSLAILDQYRRDGGLITVDTRILATAALLHDIGKLDPEVNEVVMFNGKIKRDEAAAWTIIKRHPRIGRDVIMAMTMHMPEDERLRVADAIECHHERQDGKGYYKRPLSDISPESQIITIADSIDVMQTPRPYAAAKTDDMVSREIDRCTGQFNQELGLAAKIALLKSN